MRAELDGRRGPAVLVVLAVVAGVAVVAVAGGAAMGGDGEPSGEEILNDTRERYANAESVVGAADVTVSNASATATAAAEFAAAGNKSRVALTRGNATYRAGTNGTVAWYVAPNRTAAWELDALRERAEAAHNGSNVTAVLDRAGAAYGNASVEVVRTGSDDGVEAHVLRITHENESYDGRATLWIATNDSRLLRVEATDGTNTTVVDYRDTRFNVSVHDSTFDPPDDRIAVTSFERYGSFDAAQANTSIDLPRLNATFREAGVVERADGTVVAQRYRAGRDNATVVSTTIEREFNRSGANVTAVTVNGHDANVTTVRGAAVVYWRADGVTTAVVVDASEDRAVELARRLDE